MIFSDETLRGREMLSFMDNVWRNYINKEVHSVSIFFSQDLTIDCLHDLQGELERNLNHYEWNNLQRKGLIGNRKTVIGRRRFEIDETWVLTAIRTTIKEVLEKHSSMKSKAVIVTGKCRAVYA